MAFLLVAAPPALFAQSNSSPPAAERGWESSWLEPANAQQRQQQELVRQIKTAEQAHNFHAVLDLGNRLAAMEPNSPGPHLVRAWVYRERKQFDQALAEIDQARDLAQKESQPKLVSSILTERAKVHEYQKDLPAAVSDLQASLKLNGDNERAVNNLAWLRATAPDPTFRDGRESVRLAQRAVSLSTADSYTALDTLAAAYAESSDYARALESERRAMITAETQIKDTNRARKFQQGATARLRLYEQHQAYHAALP